MKQDIRNKNRLMFLNYDKKQHSELLEYAKSIKQQGKSLNREKFLEILNYSAVLDSQVDWETRNYYLELLDQMVKKKISTSEFYQKNRINSEIVDLLESKLVLLSPDEKSLDFSDLIAEILDYCESFNNGSDPLTENYDLLNNRFQNSMEKFYLKLQEHLKNYQTRNCRNISELIDRLNWDNKEQYFEIIEKFLNNSSDFPNFKERYESIFLVAKELKSNSISLDINYKALGFSNYIKMIIELLDRYQPNSKIRQEDQIDEKVLKSWIKKIFFEMKHHYS